MSDRCITPVVNQREIISVLFKAVYWKKYWNMNLCMTKHYCNLLLFLLLLIRSSTHMLVRLYGCFESKKGSREANFNTLKNTKITIFKKTPFFNITKNYKNH